MKPKNKNQSGFTLIEMLTVVSIIGFLTSLMLVSFKSALAKARDAKRMQEVRQIATALELFYADNGSYPANNPAAQESALNGEWEVSYLPGFLTTNSNPHLVPNYFVRAPRDPINQQTAAGAPFSFFGPRTGSYYYAYHSYTPAWSSLYGCGGKVFSVVALRQLEGGPNPNLSNVSCRVPGFTGPCPVGNIPYVCREWSSEFDFSIKVVPQ